MKRSLICSIVLATLCARVYGQKLQYGGMQQLSLTFTEYGFSGGMAISNGVRFNRFYIGAGAEASFRNRFYGYGGPSCTAIYGDGRYYINKNRNFFAKLNAGVNLITQRWFDNAWARYKKYPGYYGMAGVGFKAKLGKEVFYSFDLSYGVRQIKYDYSYRNFLDQWQTDKIEIRRPMIVLNLGIEIF